MLSRLLERLEVDSAGFLPLTLSPISRIDQSLPAAVDLRSRFSLDSKTAVPSPGRSQPVDPTARWDRRRASAAVLA